MKVVDILKKSRGKGISIEVEPPELGGDISKTWKLLDDLVALGVRYIDITYHPQNIVGYEQENGHSFPIFEYKKPGTGAIAGAITQRYREQRVEAVPHVICSGFTIRETAAFLAELSYLQVQNVMALRGDSPKGPDKEQLSFTPERFGHHYSSELVKQIADLRSGIYVESSVGSRIGIPIDFCIGIGCYPEGYYPDGSSEPEPLETQLRILQYKRDNGADYIVTQMFFDNEAFLRFRDAMQKKGIELPLVPGIKPLHTIKHLTTLPEIFHCTIPSELRGEVERRAADANAVRTIGIDWCVRQCEELRREGVPGIHLYASMSAPIKEVIQRLR